MIDSLLMSTWCVIVAAGSGSRFGGAKQFEQVNGRQLISWTVSAFTDQVDGVVLVVDEAQLEDCPDKVVVVAGGASRSESVRSGLNALPEDFDRVLIHDGARPFVSPGLISAVKNTLDDGAEVVLPCIEVSDTLYSVDGHQKDRNQFVLAQTPQGFGRSAIKTLMGFSGEATDDVTIAQNAGHLVKMIEGEHGNSKITYPSDLHVAESRLGRE